MSEVVGYLLTFGILALLLSLSMFAFVVAKETAETRAILLQAESSSQRVQSAVVEASLFAERHPTGSVDRALELPRDLEGRSYQVHLEAAAGMDPDRIRVTVLGLNLEAETSLLNADAPTGFSICDSTVPGGALVVHYGEDPDNPGSYCLYLEEA